MMMELSSNKLMQIIFRNPCHRRRLNIISISILCWVLVSIRSRGGELRAQRLSKTDVDPDCKPRLRSTGCLLLSQLWDLQWRRRVDPLGGHQLFKEVPQQCSERRRQNPPHWRPVLKQHRVDLGGRLSFPAGALRCQAWRTSLHNSTIFRTDHGNG